MKKALALVLAIVMLLTTVVTVSAADTTEKTGDAAANGIQNFEFEETDARNMFDNQVIYINTIAPVAPEQDGDVSITEYTTKVTLNNFKDATNTADGYFAYKDGYVYFAVVKKGVTANYNVQIDVGNASENHPYATSADRFNQQIKKDGTLSNASYGMFREDNNGSWVKYDHPWKAAGISSNFIESAFNGIVDGNLVIEGKMNALTIMKFFAAADSYRDANVEYKSQAITWMIWLNNITEQFCTASDSSKYKPLFGDGCSVTWNWSMHTIVLPEKPASRFAAKTPAGEMVFEANDARNAFEDEDTLQVLTVSKIAETLPELDGVIGTGEYTDSYEIKNFHKPTEITPGKLSMSYKDGYLYMGWSMKASAAMNTQVDMGVGESSHPYTTVNRTTHQIKADGSLGGSGQLIRCDDQAAWNVRGNHPSGNGAAFVDKAVTNYVDGWMTYEYVVDTVRLIKWFATHEAYYDWDTVIATRCVMWQIWGPANDNDATATQTQFAVPSNSGYFGIFWAGCTITWNWAKFTIVLPEAPASHLEKYVEPPYNPGAGLNAIDYDAAEWNDLLYTVDFTEEDGYFDGNYLNGSKGSWTVTPTEDGKGIDVVGKGGEGSGSYFWGGVVGGLEANSDTFYTMVYKVKANGDVGKNNSLNVGGWITEGKAHALKFYGIYSNHNTNSDNRGVIGIGSGKHSVSKDYTMFNTLTAWAEDTDGFMTVMVEYDGLNGMITLYYLAKDKTGEAAEDWVKIVSDTMAVGEADYFGFELYGCYDVINSTIKDVQIYKGTYYPSAYEDYTTTEAPTEPPTTEPVTTVPPVTTAPVDETTAPAGEGDTTAPAGEGDTTAPAGEGDTTAPAGEGDTTTKAPAETTGKTEEPKGGCASSVVSSMVVLAIIGCGAAVATKKRK